MKKLALFLITIVLFSCRKDLTESITITQDFEPAIIINKSPVKASLIGIIKDELGNPVEGAKVTLFSHIQFTNIRGQFVFSDVIMDESGTFILVEKEGFFNGSDKFHPSEGSVNQTFITLLEKTLVGSFKNSEGGFIGSTEGTSIEFPALSVIDEFGEIYDGEVQVFSKYINPLAENLQEIMPGNLTAIDSTQEVLALATFGMIAVELETETGEALNLGNGKRAKIGFPINLPNAPDEIPLWYFHEGVGSWLYGDENAVKEGNRYVGEVSHFSFWNCDAPFPVVDFRGRLLNQDNTPISSAYLNIDVHSSGINNSGWTNQDGFFNGKIPKGEVFTLRVNLRNSCQSIYETVLGPFDNAVNLGDVSINLPNRFQISGSAVDCNESPLEFGLITVSTGDDEHFYLLDGTHNFSFSIYNCDNSNEFFITVTNLETGQISNSAQHFIQNPVQLVGNIAACGNFVDEYIKVKIHGEEKIYSYPIEVIYTYLEEIFIEDKPHPRPYFVDFTAYRNNFGELVRFTTPILNQGIYDGSDKISRLYIIFKSADYGWISTFCKFRYDDESCNLSDFLITEFSGRGEITEGNFSGELPFFDENEEWIGDLEIEVEYRVKVSE